MHKFADNTAKNSRRSVSESTQKKLNDTTTVYQLADNRFENESKSRVQELVNNSPRLKRLCSIQKMANDSVDTKMAAQAHQLTRSLSCPVGNPIQAKRNRTSGIPEKLKTNMESISGFSLDDVTVQRNSDKPAQVNAHAYAKGTDIQIGPGQDHCLPHELWHVVQQKQGRVKPTANVNGTLINDSQDLEREADRMANNAQRNAPVSGSVVTDGAADMPPTPSLQHQFISIGENGGNSIQPSNQLSSFLRSQAPMSGNTAQLVSADKVVSDIGKLDGKKDSPKYLMDLSNGLPKPPEALIHYLNAVKKDGADAARDQFINKEIHEVPEGYNAFASGSDKFYRNFKAPEITEFFIKLFDHIKKSIGEAKVEIHPYDLFHFHMYHFTPSDANAEDIGELVLVFHAKEYPSGIRNTKQSKGLDKTDYEPFENDIHVDDDDFHLRNYMYLASSNKLVRVDPTQKDMPDNLIGHYSTLKESEFGDALLDVSYFPKMEGEDQLLVAPKNGFKLLNRLKAAKNSAQITDILNEDDIKISDVAEALEQFKNDGILDSSELKPTIKKSLISKQLELNRKQAQIGEFNIKVNNIYSKLEVEGYVVKGVTVHIRSALKNTDGDEKRAIEQLYPQLKRQPKEIEPSGFDLNSLTEDERDIMKIAKSQLENLGTEVIEQDLGNLVKTHKNVAGAVGAYYDNHT